MSATITIPVWLFAVLVLVAAVALVSRVLLPGARFVLRRRVNRVIEDVNTRLHIELRPFQLTRRQVLIDRLTHDPQLMELVAAEAQVRDVPRAALQAQVKRYAREIVPAFNAYLYFRLGYWFARGLARRLYRVRVAQHDDAGFRAIDPSATVVFVMNHRSNMDYVLVAFLVAERTALSYAVGEWARIWPLQTLVRSMGAFFVRRNSGDPLYRRVLERYVHMATREGVCQAVYPEGGLSRDGRLRPPKLGFLGYMLRGFDPGRDRDVVLVPVGINYDRTLEDRTLLRGLDPDAAPRGRVFAALTALGFVARNLALMLSSRWRRLGYASAAFGTPVSVREWCARNPDSLAPGGGVADVAPLAESLMNDISRLIPVLPVAVLSAVFFPHLGRTLEEDTVLFEAEVLVQRLAADGAVIGIPQTTRRFSLATALEMLALRRIVARDEDGYRAPAASRDVLAYYANSLEAFGAAPARDGCYSECPPP